MGKATLPRENIETEMKSIGEVEGQETEHIGNGIKIMKMQMQID